MGLNLMMSMPDSWNIQPGVYAVVAATAVLAGVFRSSISLVSPSHCDGCYVSVDAEIASSNCQLCCHCEASQSQN